MDTKILARFAFREAVSVVSVGVALFWSAGRIDWWPGWGLLALDCVWIVGTIAVIFRRDPDLLAERLTPRKGSKRWDLAIISLHSLLQLATFVIAGFDQRYGWTPGLPVTAQAAAFILCSMGYAFAVWATASNPFFTYIVRIQPDRDHAVVTGGPYCYIRHPSYAGGILTMVLVPILLASWPALVIGLVDAILFVLRTSMEDRTLQAELPGYADYTRQVRYRLVPGIW
jgi:protein-S-isoprenylcysteine O-methyltransferase Ste14